MPAVVALVVRFGSPRYPGAMPGVDGGVRTTGGTAQSVPFQWLSGGQATAVVGGVVGRGVVVAGRKGGLVVVDGGGAVGGGGGGTVVDVVVVVDSVVEVVAVR